MDVINVNINDKRDVVRIKVVAGVATFNSAVFTDDSLSGNGTPGNPLSVVGGGGGTESDPVFTAWLATNPLSAYAVAGHTHSFADITSKPTTLAGYGIIDAYPLTGNPSGFLTSFTESDPVFSASAASGITGTNITNWNTAYGWGNHAIAGYLTGISGMMVTSALGYTPYDSSNPSGYITASSLSGYLTAATAASTYEPKITAGTTAQYWRGDKTWQTLDKTAVGLGSVENTALSTWAGSTNITTVGTVATGTWSATAIGATKGGTGQTTYATGDILYASASNTLSKLAAGTNGHVLTLAAGVPIWAAASGSGWGLSGNAGTVYGTNFIGTTDNVGVQFKTNGTTRMYLTSSGVLGVGLATSSASYITVLGSDTGSTTSGTSVEGYGRFRTYATTSSAFVHDRTGGNIFAFGHNGSTGAVVDVNGTSKIFIGAGTTGIQFNTGGAVAPDASCAVEIISTTKGLGLSTMTATQASAISSPKKSLLIYVTDTNGTFTSAGWWGYNGTIWKLIHAE